MKKKNTMINLIAAIIAFSANIIINFFLSPYIIKHVGVEAYGFFSLANNFVMYISVVTLAINSMAGRFITISVHRENLYQANRYYSSVFISNLILSLILLMMLIPIIYNLEDFLQISSEIELDVKFLFLLVIINFFVDMILSIFSVSYIIKNQLYISSVVQIKANFIKLICILALFYFYKPHIFYLGVGILLATLFTRIYDIYYKNKLIPKLVIKKVYFNWLSCKEMISSGIWNTITRLGNILSGNLDLLIVNLYLSATDMGILAISKMIPNLLNTITGILANVFMPNFLELFAKNKYQEMVLEIKRSMRIFSLMLSMPLVIILSYGEEFFRLWLPTQNASQLYILSILSLIAIIIIGPVAVMHNIFTVVNKIKINSLLVVFTGLINTVCALLILKYTSWGLIAIVVLTSGLSLIRNLLYTLPYGAIYLKCKWYTFFPVLIKSFVCVVSVSFIGSFLKYFFIIDTWLKFFIISVVLLILNTIIQYRIIFDKDERLYLINKIKIKFNIK